MGLLKRLALAVGISGTLSHAGDCQTVTLSDAPPTDNSQVVLSSYSYCGGNLNATVFIANLNYDKVITLYYTNRQNVSTPLSSLSLGYLQGIANTNYEYWGANVPIYVDGITRLLNITYRAVNIGQTYVQQLGQNVEASGAPEPTLPGPPAPYASPSGLSDDITQWLSTDGQSEAVFARRVMFDNINPNLPNIANGTVVAAQSGPSYAQQEPDYEYNWVRDASLTFGTVEQLYAAASSNGSAAYYENLLLQYIKARADEQNAPDLQTGLGEPKFYLNGSIFRGPWGRPQNDGPATAAITIMDFANKYLGNGGDVDTVRTQFYDSASNPNAPVKKDLLFVANIWTSLDFDLWEEEQSHHFYTRMVQRRALLQGVDFAKRLGDNATAITLASAASELSATLSQFWDPNRGLILYEYGPVLHDKSSYKDIAIALAIIHGYNGDGVYSYTNDQVLSSLLQIATSFIPIYGVANVTTDSSGRPLGIPIGRYPEDVFNGTTTTPNGGNPWFLTTAAMAQVFYSAVSEYRAVGGITITTTSAPFFGYFAPSVSVSVNSYYKADSSEFNGLTEALLGWGDAFFRRIKYHTPASGHLSEEYNRDTGLSQGAADLTWSYAALLTAAFARAEASGDTGYASRLADLAVSSGADEASNARS